MAFSNKAEFILTEQPDILIVPECENHKNLSLGLYTKQASDFYWYGDNPHKGIGIFSYGDLKIKLLDIHNPDFRYVLPLSVQDDKRDIIVFAIWAQKPQKHNFYSEQVWNAIHYYNDLLNNENVILIGDFNSNSIWDNPKRIYNHTNIVDYLKVKNIISTYHYFHNQLHGAEKDSTFFLYRKVDKPYHIDYCFASSNLINKLIDVRVGDHETWTKYSDHVPLITTFDL